MEKYIFLLLSVILFSCNTSKMIPSVQSMDDIDYGRPVSKLMLSNDTEVAYIEAGKGSQTIIMIHGLGSYLPAWKKNFDVLAANYHVIAVDLPGYGKSSKGNYEGSMTYYAGVVREFAKAKKLEKIVIAGHSMGGQIGMVTALQYPDLVEKLVLVAPAGFEQFHKGQRQWFRDVMTVDGVRLTTVEQIRSNLATNFYNVPKDAAFMVTDRIAIRSAHDFVPYCYMITKSVQGMVDEPVYDFLQDITQPTLIIFGENDNLIPNRYLNPGRTVSYAKDGASKIPDSRLEMLPKTGHFAQFEQPDAVNSLIRDFLK